MLQEIITYIILTLTFGYTAYMFVNFFRKNNKVVKNSLCSGCHTSSCSRCPFAGGIKIEQYNAKNNNTNSKKTN